ncbi:MAG: hypothetical protein H9W83_08375 [Leuconostoc sp.]|nr:hypothetical protein [Leuconostoc sp.]
MGMSTYGATVRERISFWNPSYIGTEDVKDSYVGRGVWDGSNITSKRRYYDNMYVRLNTGSQTTMNIPRIAGFIVIVFSTDVYVKSNRPRIYQVPQSETTIVETPNETTIFVGEA